MKNQTIIQVTGLGVPVQAPTNRNHEGFEVRWSSDPDISPNARVHVLGSEKELRRFIQLAVDQRFVTSDLLKIIPVVVPDGGNSLSRDEAIRAGVSPESWDLVRVALVISGNSSRGPIMDEIEWAGTREEHTEGAHMREAFEHAQRRQIRHPSIFSHNQSGHLQQAASFMAEFQRQMRPSLRAVEEMNKALERALLQLDTHNLNGDRAVHYLRQLQQAVIDRQTVQQMNISDTKQPDATPPEAMASDSSAMDEQAAPSTGPRFH